MLNQTSQNILKALQKDINRRYISTVALQSDGRLELDAACLRILNPKPNEKFFLINDSSSIIIARKPKQEHQSKIISEITYGSGVGEKIKWRLRLSQEPLRILLACKVGFRAFQYGDETALEAEPAIPECNISTLDTDNLQDLAPFILRAARSILHIDCVAPQQYLSYSKLDFRLIGNVWIYKYHQDALDTELKLLKCTDKCQYCKIKLPIVRATYWFPAVAYDSKYARPALLSFKQPYTSLICDSLLKECKNNQDYLCKGLTAYRGHKLFQLTDGQIKISLLRRDTGLTVEEKGLMKIAVKELEAYVNNFENRR